MHTTSHNINIHELRFLSHRGERWVMQLPVYLHTVQIYLCLDISCFVICMCEESWLDYEQGISFYCSVQTACGTQIAFYSAGRGRIFPGDNAAGTETDRLSLSSAEVKNEWRCTSFSSRLLGRHETSLLICTCTWRIRSHFTPSIRFGPISMALHSVSISTSRWFSCPHKSPISLCYELFGGKVIEVLG
jgi:hypothetical protein